MTNRVVVPSDLTFHPDRWPNIRARRVATDGAYFLFGRGRDEHHAWLPGPPDEGSLLSALIPIDDMKQRRSEATLRLIKRLNGTTTTEAQIGDWRLRLSLRALDGVRDGASYRQVAESLFGRKRLDRESWKTSSIRARTIRLVQGGLELMRGGYRKLLRR
ncbi:DUF2285 domain-containing protein [Methylocystis sp. IM3]|uniref:DUF2285 domain-containing protein n=1 Tax=unclassified Methylocystis TaxID=2625913 RepID=UPI0030F6D50C